MPNKLNGQCTTLSCENLKKGLGMFVVPSLFEMNRTIEEFIEKVENGEVPEEAIDDTLEGLELEFDQKVDGLASYIKSLTAESEAIKNEEKALKKRRESKEKRIDGIKSYIRNAMEDAGKKKIETSKNLVSVTGCVKGVSISNDLQFLEHYPMYKAEEKPIIPKVNKKAVYDALKNGVKLQGAELVGGKTLRIK